MAPEEHSEHGGNGSSKVCNCTTSAFSTTGIHVESEAIPLAITLIETVIFLQTPLTGSHTNHPS